MCGIACVVGLRPGVAVHEIVEAMNAKVRHRGPDAQRVEVIGQTGLGHTRLSIIDLDARSTQPMGRDGHRLSFNGEIYNYRELRAELEAAGRRFTTSSDTEVLLIALIHWGEAALDRLKGMFAFIYLDGETRTLLLARDRFGKKPLVYARAHDRFIAASEPKQIVAAREGRPSANLDAALAFLTHAALNCTTDTFFAGIHELKAGHCARLDLNSGAFVIRQWYDIAQHVRACTGSYAQARETTGALLHEAVRRRHIADVKLGACLSGGIDSSSIVTVSAGLERGGTAFPTITAYSDVAGFDERPFARECVTAFGLDAIEIKPDLAEIWNPEQMKELCAFQDQPVKGGSQYSEYCVFKAARKAGITVMLDGQGADEYFGGYGEFWFAAQREVLARGRIGAFRDAVRRRAEAQGVSDATVVRNFTRQLLASLRLSQPATPDWLKVQAPAVPERAPLSASFRQLSLIELTETSVPFQCHSEDRNSMRWSVESRLPFLDHELVEYVLGLPTEYKCARGRQKQLLRDAVPGLPRAIAGRRDKLGFALPDAQALIANAGPVRAYLEGALSRLGRIVDGARVMPVFDAMVAGRAPYDPLCYRILALDAWARAFDIAL